MLCMRDYYSKFPIVKKAVGSLEDDLIRATKLMCTKFGLSTKVVPDSGTNFVSDCFNNIASS